MSKISQKLAYVRGQVRYRLARYRRAWSYARDTLDVSDASAIIWDCQRPARFAILETLNAESIEEYARDRYGDFPGLENYALSATLRVGSKWDGSGHTQDAAQEWAIDVLHDYAVQDGIDLDKRDSYAA